MEERDKVPMDQREAARDRDMLRVMLVDDEPPARRSLRHLLSVHEDVEVVAEAASVDQALSLLDAAAPQVLFLDVELTDGKGFDLLRAMAQDSSAPAPHVVLVTAYSRYATEAFDVEAMDFLVKPVEPERLARTIERLRRRAAGTEQTGPGEIAPSRPLAGRLHVSTPGQSLYLPLDLIACVLAEGDYSRVTTVRGHTHLVSRLLGHFAADLPSPPFSRLSRSVIVNTARIDRVLWQDGGRATLFFGAAAPPLDLGRAAARRLRQVRRGAT